MDRECSWWNPKNPDVQSKYVLQHEQIHFAIIELEARRLDGETKGLQGRGASPTAAAKDLQSAIRSAVEKSLSRVLKRNHEFDEDTSLSYDPELQSRWAAEVQAELGDHD